MSVAFIDDAKKPINIIIYSKPHIDIIVPTNNAEFAPPIVNLYFIIAIMYINITVISNIINSMEIFSINLAN